MAAARRGPRGRAAGRGRAESGGAKQLSGAARPSLAPRRGLRRGLPTTGRHRRRPSRPGGAALPALGRRGADRQLHPHSDTAAIFSGAEGPPQPRCAGRGGGPAGGQPLPVSSAPPARAARPIAAVRPLPPGAPPPTTGTVTCGKWRRRAEEAGAEAAAGGAARPEGVVQPVAPGPPLRGAAREAAGRALSAERGRATRRARTEPCGVGRRVLGRPSTLVGALRGAAGMRSLGAGGCAARYPAPLLPSASFEFVCMSAVGFGRKRRIPWSECPARC